MTASPPPDVSLSRWPWWRRWFGTRSERSAARYLIRKSYRIIARNVADQGGELDLIALDPRTQELVIVEVRSTSSTEIQRPIDSVNAVKQKRLTEAAYRYLARYRLLGTINVRFDVLAMSWPQNARNPTIVHIPNAFEAVGRHQMWH